MGELLPCPFACERGIEPVVSTGFIGSAEELQTEFDQYSFTVRCICGAQGPEVLGPATAGTRDEAIRLWNTRARFGEHQLPRDSDR